MTASLAWAGVSARRMARQHLTAPATDGSPADITRAMCGAHAQILSAAEAIVGRVGTWAGERTMDAFQDPPPRRTSPRG